MDILKSTKRENKRKKARYGMRVSNRSIKLLPELMAKRAEKGGK